MSRAREVLKWHAELARDEVEPHPAYSLYRGSTALLVVDMQERLGAAMPPAVWERAVQNSVRLLQVARSFGLPILISEQYPKGLGPTVAPILEALEGYEGPVQRFEKMSFSCAELSELREYLDLHGRQQIVVLGQETHVCVFQTVRDLVELGYFVHVAKDACVSRRKDNWALGGALMHGAGATLSGTETILFDLLGSASDPEFKTLSALIR